MKQTRRLGSTLTNLSHGSNPFITGILISINAMSQKFAIKDDKASSGSVYEIIRNFVWYASNTDLSVKIISGSSSTIRIIFHHCDSVRGPNESNRLAFFCLGGLLGIDLVPPLR